MAGDKLYRGFRSRNSEISLRTPEGCSLARATSFNRHKVKTFQDVYSRGLNFADGTRIFNLDETSTTTVQFMLHQRY